MVVGEKSISAPLNPIPFEKQGVCIVETPGKKHFYFTHFTEEELERIQEAVDSKNSLLNPYSWPRYGKVIARDNLAIRFHANTVIPWGGDLMDRQTSIHTMLTSRAEIEYLEERTPIEEKATHLVTMELLRRIKLSLESFGDWRKYQPKFLKR